MATKSFLLRVLAVIAMNGAVLGVMRVSSVYAQTPQSVAAAGRVYSWPVLRAAIQPARPPRLLFRTHARQGASFLTPSLFAPRPVRAPGVSSFLRPAISAQDDYYLGAGGEWTTANNWSLGTSPNSGFNAVFTAPPTPTNNGVFVNINAECYNLTINSTNSLIIQNDSSLTVYGTSIVNQNNGSGPAGAGIQLNDTGSTTELIIGSPNVSLSGGGTILLGDPGNARILGTLPSNVLTNVDNTIEGTGNIGYDSMGLVNSGTIDATGGATRPLTIQTSNGATNTGTLEASGNSNLILDGDTYTNTGGTILASGSGASVIIQGATINGGTLSTAGGGIVQDAAGYNSVLNGVTNTGTFAVVNDSTTTIEGTITNSGIIELTSAGSNPRMVLGGSSVTLTGGGVVSLNNSAGNYIYGAAATDVLTNVNNTIQGSGNIGMGSMGLVNQGVINATQSQALTIQTSNGTTNTGTLEATAGANLILDGDTYTNTGGTLFASGSGSAVTIQGTTINGGTLSTAGGGIIQDAGGYNSVLNGVTNTGTFAVVNDSTTTIEGTITNSGVIELTSAGSNPRMVLGGSSVTLTGGGVVSLNNSAGNYIYGAAAADVLTNVNNTIQGSGNIGMDKMGLVNQATIDANQSTALYIQTSNGTTNTGTLEATAGANLILDGDTYTNTNGTILASGTGSIVTIQGATIAGGTLSTAGGGLIQGAGATLNGVTNAGAFQALGQNTTTLEGAIVNTGSIQVNAAGGFANLNASGAVTLSGGGTLVLDDSNGNAISSTVSGSSLTNVDNTISGAGNIGKGNLQFTNAANGVVDAISSQNNSLTINPGTAGAFNSGIFEASSGGTLVLENSINNTGGTIQALAGAGSNAGGYVVINGATITGGTLNTLGAGVNAGGMTAEGGALLNGVTNNGTILIPYNNNAQIAGTVTNNGTIEFACCSSTTYLYINGNTTLNGNGAITLNPDVIEGAAGTEILTNNGNTIEGNGNIGNGKLGLINNVGGTILANDSSPLIIHPNSSGFTNNGTVQANSGSTLDITGGPFNNFANNTLTGGTYNINGGTLQFDNANIVTNAANIVLTGSGSQILSNTNANALANFATNAAGGTFTLGAGRNFTTGANFTNNGTLAIGAGDTFTVSGNLTNFAASTLTGGAYNVTGILQFGASGSSLTTNAADLTLTGAGAQLLDLGGNNLLAGFNTNAGGGIFTVAGGGSFTTAGAFSNTGIADLEQASSLTISGNLTNSGTVATNNSNLQGGANKLTVTGTLTNNTGATVTIGANNDTSDTATVGLLANSGNVTVGTGATLTLATSGADTNAGAIALDGSSLYLAAGRTNISGKGTIDLINGAIKGIGSGRTLTSGNTIEGSGTISNLGITNNGVLSANQAAALVILPTSAGLTNNGAIEVSAGDVMRIGTSAGGALTNFSGSTLTGGIYNLSGILQFGASGTSIATNAANITLSGIGKMIDFGNNNVLAGLNDNAAAGAFTLAAGASLTTKGGSFTNAGSFTVSTGTTFTVGGTSFNFTQTAGTATVNGALTSTTPGTLAVNGGSLDGVGTLGYNVVDASVLTPGDSAAVTGKLTVADTYTQDASGALDIQINGTTAGTKYDLLKVTQGATLGGTLNIALGTGFTPTVGEKFTILTASSVSDTFATVNGLAINGSEHFTIAYNAGSVVLTVVSGALAASNPASPTLSTQLLHPVRIHSGVQSGAGMRGHFSVATVPPAVSAAATFLHPATGMRGFRPLDDFAAVPIAAPAASAGAGSFGISQVSAAAYNSMSATNHMRFECGVDLKALLQTSRKKLVRALWADPDSPEALSIGYMSYTGSH
jgi:hypothetical protein